jgi:magnesium transporter
MPPGTLAGDPGAPRPPIQVLAYGGDGFVEEKIDDVEKIRALLPRHAVVWVNVDGVGHPGTLEALGSIFGLHPLALEDVSHLTQRPKVDEYDQNLFIVARMPNPGRVETEQASLFLGRNFVLTFQEDPGDCLDPVRNRIRRGGRICASGPDYLAYALLDAIVDAYFPVLDRYTDELERLEHDILSRPDAGVPHRLHAVKSDLESHRRVLWSFRDLFTALGREESELISETTKLFLRDCFDHTLRLIDLLESLRENSTGLLELYLSSLSHKLNETMRVLTIIATIFIPLSVIAGIYGMNFAHMPELRWTWGYPFALGIMLAVALGMLAYFRRRGWFGSSGDRGERR